MIHTAKGNSVRHTIKYTIRIALYAASLFVFDNYTYKAIKKIYDDRFASAQLHYLPFADDDGIVIDSQLLEIQGIQLQGVYNPSIEIIGDQYLITFRADNFGQGLIGSVVYDKKFSQISEPILYDTNNALLPHDSRLFYYNDQLHLIYSHAFFGNLTSLDQTEMPPWELLTGMSQTLVQLNSDNLPRNYIELNYGTAFEKNWTPFEYIDESGEHNLYFIYTFNPFAVLCLTASGRIEQIVPATQNTTLKAHWQKRWGFISGGTPARLVDNEYLTFFHSYFNVGKKKLYVMGALTFESKPPFRVKRISRYPIIFRECYSARNEYAHPWGESKIKYVLFPGGFVPAQRNNKDTFILACGENDLAIRIITINKKKLLKSLHKL